MGRLFNIRGVISGDDRVLGLGFRRAENGRPILYKRCYTGTAFLHYMEPSPDSELFGRDRSAPSLSFKWANPFLPHFLSCRLTAESLWKGGISFHDTYGILECDPTGAGHVDYMAVYHKVMHLGHLYGRPGVAGLAPPDFADMAKAGFHPSPPHVALEECSACGALSIGEPFRPRMVRHHASYFPERTASVCRTCHGRLHRPSGEVSDPRLLAIRPPDGDADRFYRPVRYRQPEPRPPKAPARDPRVPRPPRLMPSQRRRRAGRAERGPARPALPAGQSTLA